jgi:diguanylate cyclase (GGDEF)-like protein
VSELAREWLRRCRASDAGVADDTPERRDLLVALERAAPPGALARVRGTSASADRSRDRPVGAVSQRRQELDAASETWGEAVANPASVVEQMLLLRHLVSGSSEGDRLARLVDRSMLMAARSATDRLQQAAFSDPLTGCANRRGLERDLERELARCARAELDLSVVAIDVDGLKEINDTAGHHAGDETLLRLVEALRHTLRGLDGVYRVGGDEFIVVLPDTGAEDAEVVLARVERMGAPSFSWGIDSVMSSGLFDAHLLLAGADDHLYARRRHNRSGDRLRIGDGLHQLVTNGEGHERTRVAATAGQPDAGFVEEAARREHGVARDEARLPRFAPVPYELRSSAPQQAG